MFKLKKVEKQEQGKCLAARCPEDAPNDGRPIMLCNEHGKVWQEGGCPSMEELAKRPPRAEKAIPANAGLPSNDEVKAELAPIDVGAEQALAVIAGVSMQTQAEVDWMSEAKKHVQRQLGALEQRRESITKPMNAAKRAVDDLFRPTREKLEACETACIEKLRAFVTSTDSAKAAALTQIAAGARDPGVLAVVHGGAPELPNDQIVVRPWTWEVTDLSLVPREFLTIDKDAVNFYVQHRKEQAAIPGIRVFQDVAIRNAPGALKNG